jgi:four helix bundle protein
MKSSWGSIMDTIAEGFDRDGSKESHIVLSHSKEFVGEPKFQIKCAVNKGYMDQEQFDKRSEMCDTEKQTQSFQALSSKF